MCAPGVLLSPSFIFFFLFSLLLSLFLFPPLFFLVRLRWSRSNSQQLRQFRVEKTFFARSSNKRALSEIYWRCSLEKRCTLQPCQRDVEWINGEEFSGKDVSLRLRIINHVIIPYFFFVVVFWGGIFKRNVIYIWQEGGGNLSKRIYSLEFVLLSNSNR